VIDLAIRNLGARKVRSTLCALAIVAGVFLIGVTLVMNTWMYGQMTSELARYMGKIQVQQGGSSYPPFDSSISQQTADEILARTDLDLNASASAPLLFIRTERGMMPFMPAQAMVIGVPAGKEEALLGSTEAAAGANRFAAGETGNVAILGNEAARSSGTSVGRTITVNGEQVRVIGSLESSSMASVDMATILPLETAQRIFARQGQVSNVLLTPTDVNDAAELAAWLRRDYPALAVMTQDDMLAEAGKVMRMPLMYMSSMGVTGLLVAIAIIMSTMFMAVTERTREFGTLRALGGRRRLIVGTVMAEALALAAIGLGPGIGLTFAMAWAMEASPPSVTMLALIAGIAFAGSALGGLYPAWRAANVDPLEALRYE
jgi:putative ABC transport system permease protein